MYLPTPEVGDDTATAHPVEVHDAGEAVKAEADAEIEASSFRTIRRVLRALAAQDARVVGRVTEVPGVDGVSACGGIWHRANALNYHGGSGGWNVVDAPGHVFAGMRARRPQRQPRPERDPNIPEC
ncbi:hypothetical protein AB0O91_38145 [Kitasatospora sp. NPDC089797]|uniref:hypothetical protein n=1 Tax=Kitasatospora sp. NPDC089797 TaxID=3155298 RepID=UPI003445B7FD